MGCCCSCIGDDVICTKENELVKQDTTQHSINVRMSSPGIKVQDNLCATGSGLALIGTALEQESAYWEFHISLPPQEHIDSILFGVSTKKDRNFYEEANKKSKEEGRYQSFKFCYRLHYFEMSNFFIHPFSEASRSLGTSLIEMFSP